MISEQKNTICSNCPRFCRIKKFCKAPAELKIDLYQAHFGEEPCISGKSGSGTIFFSHCNLHCVFCQNYQVSQLHQGEISSDEDFIKICYHLKSWGVHNINLVSPTCYHQKLVQLLKRLKEENFPLPIVWNSNGYERAENIKELEGLVDVYLPDFKYWDEKLALKYSLAPEYSEVAQKAISEMVRQKPECKFDDKGLLIEGLIIRHLVLPGCVSDSKNILKWLKENIGAGFFLSLMSQYTPMYKSLQFPEINRTLTKEEYDEICAYCLSLVLENVFIQDLSATGSELIPKWN